MWATLGGVHRVAGDGHQGRDGLQRRQALFAVVESHTPLDRGGLARGVEAGRVYDLLALRVVEDEAL